MKIIHLKSFTVDVPPDTDPISYINRFVQEIATSFGKVYHIQVPFAKDDEILIADTINYEVRK